MYLKRIGFAIPAVLSPLNGRLMLRRALLAGLSLCTLSLILSPCSIYAQGGRPMQPLTLPPSKLDICQFGFAYAHLKSATRKLKVTGNSAPNVVRAKDGPNGSFIILIAGKNFGDSSVTFTGEMLQGNKWVPFTQKLTVSVVACQQPLPPGQGGGGVGGGGGGKAVPEVFSVDKTICNGESYYYTLNVRAPDGSNSPIHVSTTSGSPNVASANYDSASATVHGVGLTPGVATITVTGQVEAVGEDIPFTMTIVVTVLDCKSVEVCKGKIVLVVMNGAAGATSANAKIAIANPVAGGVHVAAGAIGSTVISVTGVAGQPVGRIKVTVKNCPPPRDPLLHPDTPHVSPAPGQEVVSVDLPAQKIVYYYQPGNYSSTGISAQPVAGWNRLELSLVATATLTRYWASGGYCFDFKIDSQKSKNDAITGFGLPGGPAGAVFRPIYDRSTGGKLGCFFGEGAPVDATRLIGVEAVFGSEILGRWETSLAIPKIVPGPYYKIER